MATTLPRQLALADQHFRSGNHVFAEKLLREILASAPANARANELLAYITGNRGELDQSFALLKAATASPDASGEAFYYLGKHLMQRGQFADAAAACRQALQRIGDFFEGLHELGVALSGSGQAEAALASYDRAIALQPGVAQAWFNKGVALDTLKRPDEALQCYDRAIALDAGFAPAWRNRGATLNDLGRHPEALASHEKDIAFDPGDAQGWSNRGVTLMALGRHAEAAASHEKAITLDPNRGDAWARGAAVYTELKRHDSALAWFSRAMALQPDLPYLLGDWLRARLVVCRWTQDGSEDTPDLATAFARVRAGVTAGQRVATPFELLAMPSTPAAQRRCAEVYCNDRVPARSAGSHGTTRQRDSRIRVGYFSPDFRSHAVSFLTAGLFECHDRTRFETHAFSLRHAGDDEMTRRLRSAFEHFNDVESASGDAIAARARSLNLDIAVDLAGHTLGARTDIFARRAAPIQVNYLGFPGTMGAAYIDYILADAIVVPDADLDGFSEKVVRLPRCFQVNDARRTVAASPSRNECGLPADAFVFCCFNSPYKLNPANFSVWMNLLREIPHSVLWLVGDNPWQMQNLREQAQALGVSAQRLIFAGTQPYAQHLARYALADLVLDTLPFNGGTTTSDALWGGAPVLTCIGDTFAGRMAASLLRAAGMDELITSSVEGYQSMALHLAHHPDALGALRAKLAANRDRCALFDTARTTRHIEAAYVEMVRRLDAGLPPAHLDIPDVGGI